MTASQTITKLLASPSQVAHKLDWNKRKQGTLLALHLGETLLDLAVTSHPENDNGCDVQPLPSIPLAFQVQHNQKVIKDHIWNELSQLVEMHNVCGFLVSWPVQKQGWCGAACGKVLHVLDQMAERTSLVSNNNNNNNNCRPVCLWDGHHFSFPHDEWGRLACYSLGRDSSLPQAHLASRDQYTEQGMVASRIARDYLRHHWPQVVQREGEQQESGDRTRTQKTLLPGVLVKKKNVKTQKNLLTQVATEPRSRPSLVLRPSVWESARLTSA